MKTVADVLARFHAQLGELETALRGTIANQNIADVLASARRKLDQAAQHPDAATELSTLQPPEEPKLPFDPKGGA